MIKAHKLILEGNIPAILIYYNDQWQEEKSANDNDNDYGSTIPIKKEPEVTSNPVIIDNITKFDFGKKKTNTTIFPNDGPLLA